MRFTSPMRIPRLATFLAALSLAISTSANGQESMPLPKPVVAFFYQNIEKEFWRKCVLSPVIGGKLSGEASWRRPLWSNFYPRVRSYTEPVSAAKNIARTLREQVGVTSGLSNHAGILASWEAQAANEDDWERLYVAALRSATIAARLGEDGRAEVWTGSAWLPAPCPIVWSWTPEFKR